MNNERYNQIINEVGQKYTKWWYDNAIPSSNGKPKLDGEGILTKGEFINRIKTDSEFSEKWGLKIEERDLSLKERNEWFQIHLNGNNPFMKSDWKDFELDQQNIPAKLITITYNNEVVEVYE